LFGAFAVLWLRRWLMGLFLPAYMIQIENDVYSQIGLVMLIGLAAKNAILIVEFAKEKFESGMGLAEAALEGARLRLRPILMTSFAFILGCVPLWIAPARARWAARSWAPPLSAECWPPARSASS
jgi:HAE1 family hydrophobic/amphiphilic exporter-1